MTDLSWRPWSVDEDPDGLAAYVRPDVVAPLLPRIPAATTESVLTRARSVYELIADRHVGYAFEAAITPDGGQLIRTPHEVLWAPRHGTCLDLAVVYSGGLLAAGLPSAVIIVDPDSPELPRHALVAIPIAADIAEHWPHSTAGESAAWATMPAWLPDTIEPGVDGDVVLVDPSGLGHDLGTSRAVGLAASFEAAAVSGAAYLRSDRWTWRLGVPIVRAAGSRRQPPEAPPQPPLRDPYLPPDQAPSSMQVLRPEYELVPFQFRHELTVLRDWCEQVRAGDRTGLAVITAIGGAGKTRLALELADQLRIRGWYTGTLPRGGTAEWLAQVVSPLLVVVDYADARVGTARDPGDARRLLAALRQRPGPPAVVILTARPGRGQWWDDLQGALADDRHPHRSEVFKLSDQHPRPRDVYAQTVRRLMPGRTDVPDPPDPGPERWTTLDLVLLGWLAAQEPEAVVPSTRPDLYEKALSHELAYWATRYEDLRREVSPDRSLLRTAGAYVSLLQPTEGELDDLLRSMPILTDDPTERSVVRRLLVTCLDPGDEQGLAVRPDPVGDHLVLTELRRSPDLLHRLTADAESDIVRRTLTTVNRAGQRDPEFTAQVIADWLLRTPVRWLDLLFVAAAQGGSALAAMQHVTEAADTPIPLDELSAVLPFSALNLYGLGEAVERLRVLRSRAAGEPPEEQARLLLRHSRRALVAGQTRAALTSAAEAVDLARAGQPTEPDGDSALLVLALGIFADCSARTGDLGTALESSQEAVDVLRQRGEPDTDPAVLAGALAQLASHQSQAGDVTAAVVSAAEAVELRRRNLQPDSPDSIAALAEAIGALAWRTADAGDERRALPLALESVHLLRELGDTDPTHLSMLADSLSGLARSRMASGDIDGALASLQECADIFERLVRIRPVTYLPDFANALISLYHSQTGIGDNAGALASIERAVDILGGLSAANPAAYRSGFAGVLTSLATAQYRNGDLDRALATARTAVEVRRELAAADPGTELIGLAEALNTLTGIEARLGDLSGSLVSMQESVDLYRQCVSAGAEEGLAGLAQALSNLSARQTDVGDHLSALRTIEEAVQTYQTLVETDRREHLPGLANALNNLVGCRIVFGDLAGALAAMQETVDLYEELVQINPTGYLPEYAMALSNLSNRQAEVGDAQAALASIERAVEIRRGLAKQNPGVELPRLAMSLQNLCIHQITNGRPDVAVATIAEACVVYEELAAENPAHLPALASALNNLAKAHHANGDTQIASPYVERSLAIFWHLANDHPAAFLPQVVKGLHNVSVFRSLNHDEEGALAASRAAVDVGRQLVQASEAHRPSLAMSLASLANRRLGAGDLAEATELGEEALAIHQALANRSPTVYLPRVAEDLLQLSDSYSRGRHPGRALELARQAVEIRQRLADANPAANTAELADALNRLAIVQARNDDIEGALASVRRALPMHETLAASNPAAHVPGLALALQVLSDALDQTGASIEDARAAWEGALAALPGPLSRAEVRGAWARRLLESARTDDGLAHLRLAVAEADSPADDQTPALVESVTRARARLAIRSVANDRGLPDDGSWPPWVAAAITDEHFDFANALQRARGWPEQRIELESRRELLGRRDVRNVFVALRALFPSHAAGQWVIDLLDEIDGAGLDEVLARRQRQHDRQTVVADWLRTETWEQSQQYHAQHRAELATPEVREFLAAADTDASRQHLAILLLSEYADLVFAYAVVGDADVAEQAVLQAIEHGELEWLEVLVVASSALPARMQTVALVSMVWAVERDDTERAQELASLIADNADETERRAFCVHLRGLRERRPDLVALDAIIDTLSEGS